MVPACASDRITARGHELLAPADAAKAHQGRWRYGKTPKQTFLDSVPLAKEKLLVA